MKTLTQNNTEKQLITKKQPRNSIEMQINEKIELCGVARAFVQLSENGPRSKKFGHPWFTQSYSWGLHPRIIQIESVFLLWLRKQLRYLKAYFSISFKL